MSLIRRTAVLATFTALSLGACKNDTPTPPPAKGTTSKIRRDSHKKLPANAVAGAPGAPGSGVPAPEPVRSGDMVATLDTSMGPIKIRLFWNEVPRTVANFVGLARGKKAWKDPVSGQMVHRAFYTGLPFHRVIPSFAIQTGRPGTGDSQGPGFSISDEFHPKLRHNRAGLVTMANDGPDTGGSQFLITLRPLPSLDLRHSIFGEVISGMDVVKAISKVATDEKHRPLRAVVIRAIRIDKA